MTDLCNRCLAFTIAESTDRVGIEFLFRINEQT
jgi:hypothetical protein